MQNVVDINPEVLRWAIARAGVDMQALEIKIDNLSHWLAGTSKPTFRQLEEFAKKTHVPFGYLFLTSLPEIAIPIPFFKTNADSMGSIDLSVIDTIKTLERRQDWLRDYLIDEGAAKLPFIGRFKVSDNPKDIVADMLTELGLEEDWSQGVANWSAALRLLIDRIEDIGIITVINGVVDNSTRRPVSLDDCRGFVLVDDYAPFIFINNQDIKEAQVYTLIHELAHLWLGKTAGFDLENLLPASDPIEQLCDAIALEFLVSSNDLLDTWKENSSVNKVARKFKVSDIVLSRKLMNLGIWKKKEYLSFYGDRASHYIEKSQGKGGGGGDFYATAKGRVSIRFASHVDRAVQSGNLLHREAYQLTTLKGNTYEQFINKYLR